MSYSTDEFCDSIQTMDFDNDKQEVTIMMWRSNNKKKYTIDNYKDFCNNALELPPLDKFDDGSINEKKWYENHKIHIVVGNHDMELNYYADNVTELYGAIKEIYEIEMEVRGIKNSAKEEEEDEYSNATWKDILRFAVLDGWYEDSHCLEAEIEKCICRFKRNDFKRVMQKIENQTSINDELEVNFFKLDTRDLWKIFDEEERKQAFKEILCSNVEISELMDKDGKHYDQTIIMDYSIVPSGDLVGWHYGVDFDKNSEDNQMYIQNYIERMVK